MLKCIQQKTGGWLAELFLEMTTDDIGSFSAYVRDDTPFSSRHGVEGEEYKDVVVVFDDGEASWLNYNFSKTLTPDTAGSPTEGQKKRSRKLAYVCFSRTEENLRILFFPGKPEASRRELISSDLLKEDQITIRN